MITQSKTFTQFYTTNVTFAFKVYIYTNNTDFDSVRSRYLVYGKGSIPLRTGIVKTVFAGKTILSPNSKSLNFYLDGDFDNTYQISSELWIVRQQIINIYQLQDNRYIQVQQSCFFAEFDLNAIFTECLQDAYQLGSEAIDKLSDRFPRRRYN